MTVKLLTKHHLQFLRLKGGCRGSSESTNVNAQFEDRNKPGVYVGQFTRSTMYEKAPFC